MTFWAHSWSNSNRVETRNQSHRCWLLFSRRKDFYLKQKSWPSSCNLSVKHIKHGFCFVFYFKEKISSFAILHWPAQMVSKILNTNQQWNLDLISSIWTNSQIISPLYKTREREDLHTNAVLSRCTHINVSLFLHLHLKCPYIHCCIYTSAKLAAGIVFSTFGSVVHWHSFIHSSMKAL